MPAEEKKNKRPHAVSMENRGDLHLTCVSDVDSFDDGTDVVFTDWGELVVRGSALHIGMLNVETGELHVTGEVESLTYLDQRKPSQGLLGKLFR